MSVSPYSGSATVSSSGSEDCPADPRRSAGCQSSTSRVKAAKSVRA
ncbi:MAG: hypothetical protein IPN17_33180 [Deltaproteobacteria bacterium]|nr:hypothetical protein [Deltaproteobacteria bacterium]